MCALVTPFQANGALDLEAFGRLVDYQLAGGTHGLIVAGSTGEAHALDDAEYADLLRFAVQRVAGRIPVIAGTGTANTHKTIRLTQRAKALGADAALVVTPYYVRPTQGGLLQHYQQIAELGSLPIILYNVPGRTACDMLPETVAELAKHPNIVALKEASTDVRRMQQLLELQSPNFSVLSGDDPTFVRAMLSGARGVVSVAANLAPQYFRRLVDICIAEKHEDARELNAELLSLYDVLAVEPNPIPVKWCLSLLDICSAHLRLPLTGLSSEHRAQAAEVVRNLFPAEVQPRHSSAA
jgi:4-hydroxy-tetrahydrodipicolinate synthase